MTDYTNRRFIIFDASEKDKVNYNEVYETSAETLRLSVDGTKTFVEYDLPMPDSLQNLESKSEPLTIEELMVILNTDEWQQTDIN